MKSVAPPNGDPAKSSEFNSFESQNLQNGNELHEFWQRVLVQDFPNKLILLKYT